MRCYPDDIAIHVESRAAGIAFVDGCINLDEVVIRTGADVAATCRDDAIGDGAAKPERIADSKDQVANARGFVCEFDEREIAAPVDFDQRNIRALVGANDFGGICFSVIGCDLDGLRLVDHMVVGHGISVGTDKNPEPWPVTA